MIFKKKIYIKKIKTISNRKKKPQIESKDTF